jgi:hypothetical protein
MEQPSDVPGWKFSLNEISAGVYEIRATDDCGRSFEASGADAEELIRRAKAYVLELGPVRK